MNLKSLTRTSRYTLLASVLCVASSPSFATLTIAVESPLSAVQQQVVKIRGVLVDASSGEPIVGASVVVKGTTNGTITNFNGEYELDAPVGSSLSISFIGYKTIDVKASAIWGRLNYRKMQRHWMRSW